MKKNIMMRVASVMLIAVLLSTCTISGTFAKYVTTESAGGEARVAKWGVDFAITSDLFASEYGTEDTDFVGIMNLSVQNKTADGKNLVAPGTSGSGIKFTTTTAATPEVSYRVTFATTTGTTPETVFLKEYYPVVFTLTFNGAAVTLTSQDMADVLAVVANCTYYYNVETGKYHVSTDGGATWGAEQATAPELELSWNWTFFVDEATDVKDTALGDLAAGVAVSGYDAADYNLDVAFDITVAATQID